ncbi:MAG: DUF1697 domain-containing protein [Coriobacteriia bacterium]|nr:DUF1697 domain-containing protein [Coriobacteriia bacterium]
MAPKTYLALLRGINVGGKNKINMGQLKAVFSEAGLSDVQTYINSGNVIFSSDKDARSVQSLCETLIVEHFGLTISVAVLSADELLDAIAHAPQWWGAAPDSKHNAIFVISPARAEDICAEVGEIKPEYESIAFYGNLIFWSAPLATFSHTRWATVSKHSTYQKITIRNFTTAHKLAELAKDR